MLLALQNFSAKMIDRLTPNDFLTELRRMFDSSKLSDGSNVTIMMKHHDGRDGEKPKTWKAKKHAAKVKKREAKKNEAKKDEAKKDEATKDEVKKESFCLFRARFKKQKIRCQVGQNESAEFRITLFRHILLAKMDSLKAQNTPRLRRLTV
uniref:Signal recognition particle 14 kDa protein n=1 Tax=Steinernema glaseri TaxID=37863 RepID=A0A1I7YZP3_9BILA